MSKLLRRRWEADLGAFGGRRSKPAFSHDAFLPDLIAKQDFVLPADVAQAVTDAESTLRNLNVAGPALGGLEVLARQLLRAESVASSRIEGLVLSHRRLARAAFSEDEGDITAQSVLANIRAMEVAIQRASGAKRFDVAAILKVHQALFSAFKDSHAGKIRTEQNWIGGAASSPRDAEFIPPPPEEVQPLLEDLAAFLDRDDIPAVMQAAIAHSQFETIHPFADGNGRVGRCLIHVVLRRRGVTPRVVPPISLVLATHSQTYIKGLNDSREGRTSEWIALFAEAARTAANEAGRFAAQLAKLQAQWRLAAAPLRTDAAAYKLIELLPGEPIVDTSMVESLVKCSNQAARLALAHLEKAGVVSQLTVGRRNRAWEAPALFDLLNSFERHLATRRGGKTRLRPAPR